MSTDPQMNTDETIAQEPAPQTDAEETKPVVKKGKSAKAAKTSDAEQEEVIFRTRQENDVKFPLMGIKPYRLSTSPGHWFWRMSAKDAERADRHHHIVTGRVVRVKE